MENVTTQTTQIALILKSNLTEKDLEILQQPPGELRVYTCNQDPSGEAGYFIYVSEDEDDFQQQLQYFSQSFQSLLRSCYRQKIIWLRIY